MRQLATCFLISSAVFASVPGPDGFPTPVPKIPVAKAIDFAKDALEFNFKKQKRESSADMLLLSIRYASQEEVAISFPTQWSHIKQNLSNEDWLWVVSFTNKKNRLFVRSYVVEQSGRTLSLNHWDIEGVSPSPAAP